MPTQVYTQFNPPPHEGAEVGGESLTRTDMAAACDINNIVKKYHKTGVLPAMRDASIYADVSQMGDYRTAIEQVRQADELFMQLPSGVREKFENDPAAFLDFVSNPENANEMAEMGLIKAESEAEESAPEPPVEPAREGAGGAQN